MSVTTQINTLQLVGASLSFTLPVTISRSEDETIYNIQDFESYLNLPTDLLAKQIARGLSLRSIYDIIDYWDNIQDRLDYEGHVEEYIHSTDEELELLAEIRDFIIDIIAELQDITILLDKKVCLN